MTPLREALERLIAERIEERADDYGRDEESWEPMLSDAERQARAALAATPAPEPRGTTSPDVVPYMSEAGTDESARVAPDQSDRTRPASAPAPLDEGLLRLAIHTVTDGERYDLAYTKEGNRLGKAVIEEYRRLTARAAAAEDQS